MGNVQVCFNHNKRSETKDDLFSGHGQLKSEEPVFLSMTFWGVLGLIPLRGNIPGYIDSADWIKQL
jgi:hypothetical protein